MKQAFILAAGFGTRLLPLTYFLPKPLFPVYNTPVILRILHQLAKAKFDRVFVNLHHLSHRIENFLSNYDFSLDIVFLKEETILGTGGGIGQAMPLLDSSSPLLVYNGDIVCDIDLNAFWRKGLKYSDYAAALLIHNKEPYNNVRVEQNEIAGFGYSGRNALAYCGISVLGPRSFSYFRGKPPYSLIEVFKKCIQDQHRIKAIHAESLNKNYLWADIGTLDGYIDAHAALLKKNENKETKEWSVLGSRAKIGKNSRLSESVVWDHCTVENGAFLKRAIVTPYGTMKN